MTSREPIFREQIIDMALELPRNRRDVRSLDLRGITQALGCAHTNLYNYFLSYPQLLWEVYAVCIQRMSVQIGIVAATALASEYKLQAFYYAMMRMYLDNTGQFWLAWLEYSGKQHPESNASAVATVREQMNHAVTQIWRELSGQSVNAGRLEEAVRFAHCYFIGEISNYISGHRVTEDEEEFCQSVVHRAIRSTVLLPREG